MHDKTIMETYDEAPLNGRYWFAFSVLSLIFVAEYFDFYIVGFLLAVLGPLWKLTYGQSAVILFSAGLGSIVGSLACGLLSDAWGRKKMITVGSFACGAASIAIGLIPDGAWLAFALLRFAVGFGLGAAVTPSIALAVELTPTRFRTIVPGLMIVFATVGTLLASATAAVLLSVLGWRGVAMMGVAPVIPGILVFLFVPESMRWLISLKKTEQARLLVAKQLGIPVEQVPTDGGPIAAPKTPSLRELYSEPSRFWFTVVVGVTLSTAGYGVYLWGPTITALLLGIGPTEVGRYFVLVAAAGITGKIVMSVLPHYIGRRRCGEICGYGILITLGLAGYFNSTFAGTMPLFVVFLCCGALFFDGGHSNASPYIAEIFPVRLAAGGVGLSQAANGVGKILGPLSLAVIAGTDNFVAPQATAAAIIPGFMFLAGCGLLMGLAFTLYRTETRGHTLKLSDDDLQRADKAL